MAKGIHDSRYRWMITQLVQERKKQGLSQADVADRLSKPQQYVSRYEVGERRLDMVEFLEAAAVLDVDGLRIAAEGMASAKS